MCQVGFWSGSVPVVHRKEATVEAATQTVFTTWQR